MKPSNSPKITERDVVAFLAAKATGLMAKTGEHGASVSLSVNTEGHHSASALVHAPYYGNRVCRGPSLNHAIRQSVRDAARRKANLAA